VNPRVTGLLFLVAAALAAFVYFYEIRGEPERQAAEEAQKRLFADVSADAIEAIALTSSDGVAVRAERREGGWSLVEPLAFPADRFAFDTMASSLAELTSEGEIEDPQPDAVYGLADATHEVRFTVGGSEHALRVGDETPVGASTYVSVAGAAGVYTVPTHRVSSFSRAVLDLRDRRVLDFDRNAVNRIEARWTGGEVALERGEGGWRVVRPLAGPADEETVTNLLSDLGMLRAIGFVDDPPADVAEGFEEPVFAVRLSGEGSGDGGAPFEVGLAIANRSDGESRLVRAEQPSLYRIAEERLEDFPTDLVAYRFKQLSEFDAADAERVDMLFHSAGGASVAITAERGENGWTSTPESFAAGRLSGLIGALANLRAKDIAAESMGTNELAGVGLEPANAVYVVRGPAPAAAAGEGEAPVLAEIQLGRHDVGRGIFARRAGDDTVYLLDYELAEHLPVSYEAFENRFRSEAVDAASGEADAASSEPKAVPNAAEVAE